jgi:hypothetical protein
MLGAIFPQNIFQMPQKKMGHSATEDMMMPAWIFSDLIVVHAQFRFGFFETLLYGPAQAPKPHKSF